MIRVTVIRYVVSGVNAENTVVVNLELKVMVEFFPSFSLISTTAES